VPLWERIVAGSGSSQGRLKNRDGVVGTRSVGLAALQT
jgi:hypothetical protein